MVDLLRDRKRIWSNFSGALKRLFYKICGTCIDDSLSCMEGYGICTCALNSIRFHYFNVAESDSRNVIGAITVNHRNSLVEWYTFTTRELRNSCLHLFACYFAIPVLALQVLNMRMYMLVRSLLLAIISVGQIFNLCTRFVGGNIVLSVSMATDYVSNIVNYTDIIIHTPSNRGFRG